MYLLYFLWKCKKEERQKKLSGRDSLNGKRGIRGILKSLWKIEKMI